MGHKESTNGEPGLVVEITTPLTAWWGTKMPQMFELALWLKWPHHLLPDGAQRGHKWWARPCGWIYHTTYKLMGHKKATYGESGLVVHMTTPLTSWWCTKRPQMVSQPFSTKYIFQHTKLFLFLNWWLMECAGGSDYIVWRLCDDAYMLTIPSVKSYIYKTLYILSEYNIEMSTQLLPWKITYLLYFNVMFANSEFVSQILDIVTYILHKLLIFKFTLIFITHTSWHSE